MSLQGQENGSKNEESPVSQLTPGRKPRAQFSGSCSFLVSLCGYSMGNSDFWRFPYLVFRNGGGAFLIPFALFMIISGMPMLFFEVTTSQFSGCGPFNLWNMAPFFKGIGFTLLIINLVGNVYHNILRAWILDYLVNTFKAKLPWEHCGNAWNKPGCVEFEKNSSLAELPPTENATYILITSGNVTDVSTTLMTAAEQYWQYGVLQLSSGFGHFDGVLWNFVLYAFVWRLLISICMIKSIKSIEKVMYVTVFIPIILMIIIFVRALTLNGATEGMLYYLTPTFTRITDVKVWIEAALMATYTLGPGWGTIPTIGSHNKYHGNTIEYSILSTFFDFLSAVLNGLICFAILGVMSHDSGLELENTVTSGLSLGFTVYPTAFTYFPLPQVWSAVFFINLLLVGLDSQVLSAETVMNCLQDIVPTWFVGRRRVYMIILFNTVFFILTLPFCTRGGIYLFQLLDWYAAAWTLLFVCFVECLVFTWIYGCERLNKDIMIMMGRPLPIVIRLFGSFLTPAAILILLILTFLRYKPPTYGSYIYPDSAEIIGWCLATAIISPIFIVFIYKLFTTQGSFYKKLRSIKKSSALWGPNDEVSMTTYHDKDNITQSEVNFKSTLTYNVFGRCHSSRCQQYSVNTRDGVSVPMLNLNGSFQSKSDL